MEQYPRDTVALARLRDIDVDNGTPDLALARYKQSFPELFPLADNEPGGQNFDAALHLVFLLQQMDRFDEANALLEKTAWFLTENPEQGNQWHRARLYALQGKLEDAIKSLVITDEDHDGGLGVTSVGLEADRILNGLHDDPRYIAIVERRDARMSEQLASWGRIKTEEGWDPF